MPSGKSFLLLLSFNVPGKIPFELFCCSCCVAILRFSQVLFNGSLST